MPTRSTWRDLAKDPAEWPESTRRISQLRLTIEYTPTSAMRRAFTTGRLHVDIVDYPGEWLIDLPLLELSFADWSRQAVAEAHGRSRAEAARPWLEFLSALDPDGPADEQIALAGAARFTRYLQQARTPDAALAAPGPGRFLLPGDLAGSPLLTFFPMPAGRQRRLRARHARRHAGAPLRELQGACGKAVLPRPLRPARPPDRAHRRALRASTPAPPHLQTSSARWKPSSSASARGPAPGSRSILPRRVDRLLFAATKADHLHHTSHDRLEAILRLIADKAIARAEFAGAEVKVIALAALRSTREAEARSGWQRLPCIVGVPLPGERLGGKVFGGATEAAVFPGDLPADPADLEVVAAKPDAVHFLRFRPPRLVLDGASDEQAALPHIRLDRAMDFLLGDKLA